MAKGDNVAYATYENSLAAVKDGSFLRFEGENCFYVVQRKESTTFLHDFTVVGANIIRINENLDGKIHSFDKLTLSFREQELDIVIGIVNAGAGYAIGDVLTVQGGKPSLDVVNGVYNATQIVVNGVKEGQISRIGVKSRGKYIEVPPPEVLLGGGKGKNAKFEISYRPLQNVTQLNREVLEVRLENSQTLVILDSNLPSYITCGKISFDKWLFYLATPYISESRRGVGFSVTRDFTPAFNIPLMVPDSITSDVVYNKGIVILEEEILKLNRRIDELSARINGS